jgi:hypothetical protein
LEAIPYLETQLLPQPILIAPPERDDTHSVGEKLAIKYENCDLRESASFYGAVEIL